MDLQPWFTRFNNQIVICDLIKENESHVGPREELSET